MNIFAVSAFILVALMIVMIYRAIVGPTTFDRFLSAMMSGTTAAFALAMIAFWFERPGMFTDILLGYALLNFIVAIALGKFLEQRRDWSS